MPVRAPANDEFRKPGQFGANSSGDLHRPHSKILESISLLQVTHTARTANSRVQRKGGCTGLELPMRSTSAATTVLIGGFRRPSKYLTPPSHMTPVHPCGIT